MQLFFFLSLLTLLLALLGSRKKDPLWLCNASFFLPCHNDEYMVKKNHHKSFSHMLLVVCFGSIVSIYHHALGKSPLLPHLSTLNTLTLLSTRIGVCGVAAAGPWARILHARTRNRLRSIKNTRYLRSQFTKLHALSIRNQLEE